MPLSTHSVVGCLADPRFISAGSCASVAALSSLSSRRKSFPRCARGSRAREEFSDLQIVGKKNASGQDAPSFAELQKQCKEAADAAKKAASDLKTEQEKTKRVTKDFNSQLKNLREHVGTDDENDEDGPASGKKKKKKKKKTPAPPSDGEKEE
jgi:flagellar motility protein MotE (MotC chaperone)